jgi:hypothetical protein
MTTDRLTEIEKRARKKYPETWGELINDDIPRLIARVKKLEKQLRDGHLATRGIEYLGERKS